MLDVPGVENCFVRGVGSCLSNPCLCSCVTAQLRGNTNHTVGVMLESSACANMIVAGGVAIVEPPFGREQDFAGISRTLMGRDSTCEEGRVGDGNCARSTRKISSKGDSGSTRYLPVRLVPALCRLHFNLRRARCGAHQHWKATGQWLCLQHHH